MDLSSFEAAATTSRHAVVLFGTGAGIAAYLAYYFAVQKNEGKRLDLQRAAAILAILGVGATALNFYYTAEISSERDRFAKAKDAELERFKVEKDTEIKNLEQENLILRQDVGILEKSNLKAAKEVASLQIEVAAAKRRQAEAEMKLAVLQNETFEARRRQAETDSRMAALKNRQEARVWQEPLIVSMLNAAPPDKVIVLYQQGFPEVVNLASNLRDSLLWRGWKILQMQPVPEVPCGVTSDFVFTTRTWANNKKPVSLRTLEEVFTSAGFISSFYLDTTLPDDTLRLFICPKPHG